MPADTTVGNGPARQIPRTDAFIAELDHLVQSQPLDAIARGRMLLRDAPDDPELGREVWSVIGRALYELGDTDRAAAAMRRALRCGASISEPIREQVWNERLTAVQISAAAIFAEAGRLTEGLALLDQVEQSASPQAAGRVQSQRAYVLTAAGHLGEASAVADTAEITLRRGNDHLGRLRLLTIQSHIHLQMGNLVRSRSTLLRARRLAEALGQDVIAAGIVANLGVVESRAGRLMQALQRFDEAHHLYECSGRPLRVMAVLEADRAEALLRAGLVNDAVAAAHVAVSRARSSGSEFSRGDAELVLARTELAAGVLSSAMTTAASAARLFRKSGRRGLVLQARGIGLQAALGLTTSPNAMARLVDQSRRVGDRLTLDGWAEMSDDLRGARLRCASRLNRLDDVVVDLDVLRECTRSRLPTVAMRAWYAETLARVHAGDQAGAIRAARQGLRVLDRFRNSSADLQVRTGLSAIGADLGSLALHLAVTSGSARIVLEWAERTRAHAFIETDVKSPSTISDLSRQLDRRVLVEFVIDRDEVFAVVVRGRRAQLVALGSLLAISQTVDQLVAQMDRAVRRHAGDTDEVSSQIANRLGALLIQPLAIQPTADLILVPVGDLHAVPWSALPHLGSATVSVHLSAGLWVASDVSSRAASTKVTLIVGPDVMGEAIERASIRRWYPGASAVLRGERASPRALAAALSSERVVQIAAHGSFNADRPLQSTLRLHAGEMAIRELHDLEVASKLIVLSSCEGGMHGVTAGGEVLGLVALLLARGASTIIAALHTVPDVACAEFVSDFHREWATGITASMALSVVRQRWLGRPAMGGWVTAGSFVCFGSGMSRFEPMKLPI